MKIELLTFPAYILALNSVSAERRSCCPAPLDSVRLWLRTHIWRFKAGIIGSLLLVVVFLLDFQSRLETFAKWVNFARRPEVAAILQSGWTHLAIFAVAITLLVISTKMGRSSPVPPTDAQRITELELTVQALQERWQKADIESALTDLNQRVGILSVVSEAVGTALRVAQRSDCPHHPGGSITRRIRGPEKPISQQRRGSTSIFFRMETTHGEGTRRRTHPFRTRLGLENEAPRANASGICPQVWRQLFKRRDGQIAGLRDKLGVSGHRCTGVLTNPRRAQKRPR